MFMGKQRDINRCPLVDILLPGLWQQQSQTALPELAVIEQMPVVTRVVYRDGSGWRSSQHSASRENNIAALKCLQRGDWLSKTTVAYFAP